MTGENATKVEEHEGHSITLTANITKHEKEDDVQWLYEENTLIARLYNVEHIESYPDTEDGRFRDRLKLDNNTGSLTISNIGKIHSGHFKLKIQKINLEQEPVCQGYSVTVHCKLKGNKYMKTFPKLDNSCFFIMLSRSYSCILFLLRLKSKQNNSSLNDIHWSAQ